MATIAKTLERLKTENEHLIYEVNGNTISVTFCGKSFQVAEDNDIHIDVLESCKRMHKFFSLENKMIKDGYSGWYAVVKPDLSVMIVSTEDEAITASEENPKSFIHRIDESTECWLCE